MGSISAWWSEQVWNDLNCRLNINYDTIHNDNRDYQKRWWVNGGLAFSAQYGTAAGVPLPGSHSWRYPAGTTFEFLVQVSDYFVGEAAAYERDRAGWGPGAFPSPPTPPGAAAPAVSASYVHRNMWDITVWGGGTSHYIYVYDPVNGEPLYASAGGTATYRYSMPVGVRDATIRGRAQNIGAAGAGGPVADSFYAIGSANSFPTTPTGVSLSYSRRLVDQNFQMAWTHTDPNGDPQSKYEIQKRKLPSGGWTSLGVVTSSAQTRDLQEVDPGDYQYQVRTYDWEGFAGPWSAAVQITIYQTQIREGGVWDDGYDDYVRSGGLWVPTRKLKLPL